MTGWPGWRGEERAAHCRSASIVGQSGASFRLDLVQELLQFRFALKFDFLTLFNLPDTFLNVVTEPVMPLFQLAQDPYRVDDKFIFGSVTTAGDLLLNELGNVRWYRS